MSRRKVRARESWHLLMIGDLVMESTMDVQSMLKFNQKMRVRRIVGPNSRNSW